MRIVGAGLGRTGTLSLKQALERLLGQPCYHMLEVLANPGHVDVWHEAIRGNPPEWREFFGGYGATVDWPAVTYYHELADIYPDSLVLLSTRDADVWWRSANRTIFESMRRGGGDDPAQQSFVAMATEMFQTTFAPSLEDEDGCKAAFEQHNQRVRDTIPHDRLVEWQPGDGWEPLCTALDLPVPEEAFPHTNTTEEFLEIRRPHDDQDTPP